MFSSARALVLAGERLVRGDLDAREERAALLARFYGEDLGDEERAQLEARLRAA
jgi:hypothetical protein